MGVVTFQIEIETMIMNIKCYVFHYNLTCNFFIRKALASSYKSYFIYFRYMPKI